MGIHPHTLMLLQYASKRLPLGRVATMGRQEVFTSDAKLRSILGPGAKLEYGRFCEELLKSELGSSSVDSFDNSTYEDATHIFDFNRPIAHDATYETILNGGFLEHIFNVPQALENMSNLCAVGGQILHVLPANNLCGHGFYQFAPELFLTLYSEQNGYSDTQVFLADVANEEEWFEVREPSKGEFVVVVSSAPVWMLVRTRKTRASTQQNIQQAYYVHVWDGKPSVDHPGSWAQRAAKRMAKAAKESLLIRSARYAERKWQELLRPAMSISASNPNLKRHAISSLLSVR
jgi:hypothetical protein